MNPGPTLPGARRTELWVEEVEAPPELQALRATEECLHFARRNLAFARQRKTRLQPEVRALADLADQLWVLAARAAQEVADEAGAAARAERARARAAWEQAAGGPGAGE